MCFEVIFKSQVTIHVRNAIKLETFLFWGNIFVCFPKQVGGKWVWHAIMRYVCSWAHIKKIIMGAFNQVYCQVTFARGQPWNFSDTHTNGLNN